MEGVFVAAKRAKAAPGKDAQSGRKKNLFVIRGYEAWGEWVEEMAAKEGMPVTVLIDQALRERAERRGHPQPPRRY
jgi:hypothetical protein